MVLLSGYLLNKWLEDPDWGWGCTPIEKGSNTVICVASHELLRLCVRWRVEKVGLRDLGKGGGSPFCS